MITELMKKLGIEHYSIREEQEETAELFFVKKALDMTRMKDVTKTSVTVFRDFEENGMKFRGSSLAVLAPGQTEEETEEALKLAYNAAGNVRNPWYELYKGETEPVRESESGLLKMSLSETAARFAAALFLPDTREDAFINSAEIFASKTSCRFISSEGFTNAYVKYGISGEFVVQCREPLDVEQYFSFEYEEPETEALTRKAEEALNTVRDRANAENRPKAGVYDIILTGEHTAEILSFYAARSNAAYVAAKYFNTKPGDNLQGEEIRGEKLNLDLLPSAPYSPEGIPMKERELLREGVLQFLQGETRYCRYLDIEPTGNYRRIRCHNGSEAFESMKQGCLYPVSFSDFQMDPISGRFGGEIRLAYLFTDHGTEILSGGSINGSLLENQGNLSFSQERYTDASYSGPFAIKLRGIAVNGE